MKLNIYCDGGARGNPGPAAAACVIKADTGKVIHTLGVYIGIATNNIAEYRGVLLAYDWLVNNAVSLGVSSANFNLDSLLVVNQLMGKYKTKNDQLKSLNEKISELHKSLAGIEISYGHIPRNLNSLADSLVNKTLDMNN